MAGKIVCLYAAVILTFSLAQVAHAEGIKTILNPAPAVDLRKHDLSSVFALTPNETEGRICLGLEPDDSVNDDELASALLELGVENVVLTLGSQGVIWASRKGIKNELQKNKRQFCRLPGRKLK